MPDLSSFNSKQIYKEAIPMLKILLEIKESRVYKKPLSVQETCEILAIDKIIDKIKKVDKQIIYNEPEIGANQGWKVLGYLHEKAVRTCPRKWDDFDTLQYIGESGGYHHWIGDGKKVLVCSIIFK